MIITIIVEISWSWTLKNGFHFLGLFFKIALIYGEIVSLKASRLQGPGTPGPWPSGNDNQRLKIQLLKIIYHF